LPKDYKLIPIPKLSYKGLGLYDLDLLPKIGLKMMETCLMQALKAIFSQIQAASISSANAEAVRL
jgi:hypothetical protein